MIIMRGSSAVSSFRIEKLLQAFDSEGLKIKSISANYVHLIDAEGDLTSEEKSVLEKILSYGPISETVNEDGELFFVVPRIGTISPWASKATDIAHNCGLTKIRRVERGIAWHIQNEDHYAFSLKES